MESTESRPTSIESRRLKAGSHVDRHSKQANSRLEIEQTTSLPSSRKYRKNNSSQAVGVSITKQMSPREQVTKSSIESKE